jgi:hypothetical protein
MQRFHVRKRRRESRKNNCAFREVKSFPNAISRAVSPDLQTPPYFRELTRSSRTGQLVLSPTGTPVGPELNLIAWIEPTTHRIVLADLSKPTDVRFLNVQHAFGARGGGSSSS